MGYTLDIEMFKFFQVILIQAMVENTGLGWGAEE